MPARRINPGWIHRRRGAAFTLVEVLVVIVILGLLLSILISSLRLARRKTQSVLCMSNLNGLNVSLRIYHEDNSVFPIGFRPLVPGIPAPPGDYPGDPVYDWRGFWWFHYLDIPYERGRERQILRCPSRCILGSHHLSENILCGNYGVNQTIMKSPEGISGSEFVGKSPMGLSQIRSPSLTLVIVDSGYSLVNWRAACDFPTPIFDNAMRDTVGYIPGMESNLSREIDARHQQDAYLGRHPSRTVNAGYADGHADHVSADRLGVSQEGEILINRSPLWIPN